MSLHGTFLINSCPFGANHSIFFKRIACPVESISHNNNKMSERNQKASAGPDFEGNFKTCKFCDRTEQGSLQALCILFPVLAMHI